MTEDWTGLERAARELHQEWDSPQLWPRIEARMRARRRKVWLWGAAVAAMLIAAVSPGVLHFAANRPKPSRAFLTQRALEQLQQAESAYVQSIDQLSTLVEPSLVHPVSPLLASYREKLALLDQAIADLRTETTRNPYHAGLRMQLGQIYREKQITLQEVLRHAASDNR